MVDPNFWHGKRVLVTGHTGFKGSWLTLWLSSMGAEVSGYALAPPTTPSVFTELGLAHGIGSVVADVRDAQRLKDALVAAEPDIVLHLAAQPLVRHSYADPVGTYATNVLGTVHLLEAVRGCPGVRVVVNVTSDKSYENREWEWGYRETDPMGGHDPYSSSKGCSELITAAYRSSFFRDGATALASARAGNVIGGGDWAEDRLVPDILRAFAGGAKAEIRNPDAIRPWQHILEPLSGYLALAERLWHDGAAYAEAWNFGPFDADARRVSWIADALAREWGDDAAWVADERQHPHEATYLKLDISKAQQRLGWRPRWSLEEALGRVVAWHRAWLAGDDVRALSLQQIDDYTRTSLLKAP
jgi:CDP-glucose 4,6-dehydratase